MQGMKEKFNRDRDIEAHNRYFVNERLNVQIKGSVESLSNRLDQIEERLSRLDEKFDELSHSDTKEENKKLNKLYKTYRTPIKDQTYELLIYLKKIMYLVNV
jgi:hypothetical protein